MKENKVKAEFAPGEFGVGWGGQSMSIQRIIRGHDLDVRRNVESEVDALVEKQRESMKNALLRILGPASTVAPPPALRPKETFRLKGPFVAQAV